MTAQKETSRERVRRANAVAVLYEAIYSSGYPKITAFDARTIAENAYKDLSEAGHVRA